VVTPQNCKFPGSVIAVILEEALYPFQINLKSIGTSGNFQVVFQNFTVFKDFIDEILPQSKICTKSTLDPFSIQFSFDCFEEDLQDEALLECFSDRLERIGIQIENSSKTGIHHMEFPNIEFLFIFLVKTLQNLNR